MLWGVNLLYDKSAQALLSQPVYLDANLVVGYWIPSA